MPNLAELMRALPESPEAQSESPVAFAAGLAAAAASMQPVPVGRFRRMGTLATLQAKIAAAYFFYWLRGWFQTAGEKEKSLAEAHWKTALRLLDSMSYLRGAVMKAGQTLANYPGIVPREFVETLDRLHYDAPPMHWSLLRERVCGELGGDPEQLFASFETRAFAAASLGQVHAARLHSGESVVVKIQYPGIGRALAEDLRNLILFMFPARFGADWESMKDQMDDFRARLEQEADYENEAAMLIKARALFKETDGIVVPRVYPQQSTRRVLTMDRLGGVHLDTYLAANPSQAERDEAGRKILQSWYRMFFAGRMFYADYHPGNLLFMEDGRIGLLDFGFVMVLDDPTWATFGALDRAQSTGRLEDRVDVLKSWSSITDDPADADRLRLTSEYAEWVWRPRYLGGMFDFGDEAHLRRGIDLFMQMVKRRYSRAKPCTFSITRQQLSLYSILYRLKAKVDVRQVCEAEAPASGWDRGDYAFPSQHDPTN